MVSLVSLYPDIQTVWCLLFWPNVREEILEVLDWNVLWEARWSRKGFPNKARFRAVSGFRVCTFNQVNCGGSSVTLSFAFFSTFRHSEVLLLDSSMIFISFSKFTFSNPFKLLSPSSNQFFSLSWILFSLLLIPSLTFSLDSKIRLETSVDAGTPWIIYVSK